MSIGVRDAAGARRLFFALWLTASLREQLQALLAPRLPALSGRVVPPIDWHVTLCFLGSVPEPVLTRLTDGAARLRVAPFALVFSRLAVWRAARVFAALSEEPAPSAAQSLARALRQLACGVGLVPDDRPLRAHVTLVRDIRRARCADATVGQESASPPAALPLVLMAEEFCLAESVVAGATPPCAAGRYRVLARWPLHA